jgi:hypothetical protein
MGLHTDTSEILESFNQSVLEVSKDLLCKQITDKSTFVRDYSLLLIEKLNTFSDSIYTLLNESIFEGVYVKTSEIKDSLSKIEKEIIEFNPLSEDENLLNLNDFLIEELLNKRLKEIISSINAYQRFVSSLEDRMKFSETKYYVNTIQKARYDTVNLKSLSLSEYCKFFDSNLFVAFCDHFVSSVDKNVILNLEDVINFAQSKKYTRKYNLLWKKALFIRNKFAFRDIEEIKSPDYNVSIYVANKNGNTSFSSEDFINNNSYLSSFKNWNEYLLNHYEINSNWKSNISNKVILGEDFSKLSNTDLHLIVKYAKDIIADENLIIEARKNFKERISLANNEFDKYALKICVLYCYNNQFSLLVEKEDIEDSKIESLYNEIGTFIHTNRINNFFASGKYIRFLTKKIKQLIDQKNVFNQYEVYKNLLVKCYDLINIYSKNIEWVKQNYNYTFQLPLEDCLIEIDKDGFVFISSSFMLPISRKRVDEKFKNDKELLELYKITMQGLSFTMEAFDEITALKAENQKVRDAFEESEKRKLEVITVITAIIAFISGSIPGFEFIETPKQAVFFALALGTSLSFFVLLLYVLNRKLLSNKSLIIGSICFTLVVIASWTWIFFAFPSNLKDGDQNKLKKKTVIQSRTR